MTKKKTKTKQTAVKQYKVLIPCSNDATGQDYGIGDTVTGHDFSAAVIVNWMEIKPPVLKEVS